MSASLIEKVPTDPVDRYPSPVERASKIRLGGVMIDSFVGEEEASTTNGEYEAEVEYISFENLEAEYLKKRNLETEQSKCSKFTFRRGGEEITDLTGYNTTQPILDVHYDPDSGKPYVILGVRMENRADEENSRVIYFRADKPSSKVWDEIHDEELPEIMGQDPSATELDEGLFLSVIEVESVPDDSEAGSHLNWRPRFYKGPDIRHLAPIGRGPDQMKNITPVKMPTHNITTFTRPQSPGNEALGGLGQIGEVTTATIEEIADPNTNVLQNAELINTRFLPGEEWGGIKYGIALNDGRVGVVGHIARFDKKSPLYKEDVEKKPKKYATISGKYNPLTRKIEDMKIEALADEFPGVEPKDEYLEDVVYTTAMTDPDESGKVEIIQGVGDAETWSKEIDDPFAGLRLLDQSYPLAA